MPKFFDLCSDSLWGIRKACAECFMMVSNSTSPEVRRAKLSPLFISLISDQSRWVRHTHRKKSNVCVTSSAIIIIMKIELLLRFRPQKYFSHHFKHALVPDFELGHVPCLHLDYNSLFFILFNKMLK